MTVLDTNPAAAQVSADDAAATVPPQLSCPRNKDISSAQIRDLPPSAYYIPSFITPAEEAHILHHINSAPLPTWKHLSNRRLQAYPSVLSPTGNTLLAAPLPDWLADPIVTRLLRLTLTATPPPTPSSDPLNPKISAQPAHESGDDSRAIFSGSPHGGPNHCLVNEYLPGQGIHPHEDGGAYWPLVATVSLGSHAVLQVSRKRGRDEERPHDRAGEQLLHEKTWRVLQERRSLLISTGEVYTDCLHGIEGVRVDEDLRAGKGGVVNFGLLGDREAVLGEGRMERETRVSLTFRDVLRVKKLGKAFGGLKR